ncbi:MAG TPA: hypothetical protein VIS05_08300 [Ilumatobacter sp.]
MTTSAYLSRGWRIRVRTPAAPGYNGAMHDTRATIRLATILSTVAALAALGLDALGGVPDAVVVLAVIAIGFAASWVQTNRATRAVDRHRGHRMAVVPLRQPVG